ncbi:MAG TPA: serine/threonine-protein kinase [Candidatus Acidoferrum sp.]|nr:serine/threonine-protein kinase [Candidatus Acidoferrum sp.]
MSHFKQAGDTISRYTLLQQIGEGGCGVVWLAEQNEPVRRRVALKIIKLGMDTRQVVARFEAERQALAIMDHPNIAKVFDAGATQAGRPFFVMELVRGARITHYCDQHLVSTKKRLELFIQVCTAVQHAHQKGIIHRDIKPSNILVTVNDGLAVPKIIDFGIAKATQGSLTDKTLITPFEQFIGTPAYMSPEQAAMTGQDIDTRSDIYSLGVLLYELLTGRTPFDTQELLAAGLDRMRRTIREQQPPRPSTRLKSLREADLTIVANARRAEPGKLRNLLRGDLDWIVMKCLEKDRTRRYEAASNLAKDIERHLHQEPVVARPPSRFYEFQKTVRRHWVGFALTSAVIASLSVGIIVSGLEASRARRAEREKNRLRQQTDARLNNEAQLRSLAGASEQKAVKARAAELAARQRAYASDMNLAKEALDANNLGRALDLLNRQRPEPGQKDLRGWEWRYLWEQCHGDTLFTLCQESSQIHSLAASPDGNWLAIGSYHQGGLSVWDLRTRQPLLRLAKNEGRVLAAFSSTEPLLAFTSCALPLAGPARNTLRLWNMASRSITAEFPLDSQCVGIAFSQDGRRLVTSTSSGAEGQITLWRMQDGTKLAFHPSPQAGKDLGAGFAATADLRLAACAMAGGRIRLIDLRNGKDLWTVVGAEYIVTALAFSPDGKTLASGSGPSEGNADIRLWNVASGTEIGRLDGHGFRVSSLVFWPDGKRLASSSADQTLRTWDLASRKCLNVLHGHHQEVWSLALLPDAKTLVSGAKDGTICFWDSTISPLRHASVILPENVVAWRFTPDSRSVLTVNPRGQLSRWSGSDFQRKEAVEEIGTNHGGPCLLSQDGRLLALSSSSGVLQIWDVTQRVLSLQWTNTTGEIAPLSFFAGGTKLILRSLSDNLFHELDLVTGSEIQSWQGPASPRQMMAFSPDERSCVAIDYEGGVVFRNLAGESSTRMDLNLLEGLCGCYSPDGLLLAAASDMGYARVWDAASWQQEATLGGFFNKVVCVCFSPESKRLAGCVGNPDGDAVQLWDVDSWQEVLTLHVQGGALTGVAFSPDGSSIGATKQGGTMHLWRAPPWAEIETTEKAQAMIARTKPN